MSVELYIQGYSAAGEDGLETPEVLKIFRIERPPGRPEFTPLAYILKIFRIKDRPNRLEFLPLAYDSENSCELSVHEADRKATALTVFRPCGHERFWADVFELLSRGPYVAFMPGSPILLVNAEAGGHLPEEMVEALGPPRQVSTVGDLVAQIMNG